MLTIRLSVTGESRTGFAPGVVCVGGADGDPLECIDSMVVLSATLLLDQLTAWPRSAPVLEFNPIDSSELIEFRRQGKAVEVWVRGRCVGEATEPELRAAAIEACAELFERFARSLDAGDAGRQDLEAALADAKRSGPRLTL